MRRIAATITGASIMLALVCDPVALRAQVEGLALGLRADVALLPLRGNVPLIPGSPACGMFTDGIETSIGLRGLLGHTVADGALQLRATVGISSSSGRMVTDPDTSAWVYDDRSQTALLLSRKRTMQVERQVLILGPEASFDLSDRLSLRLGIDVAFALASSISLTESITAPVDRAFADGQRDREMSEIPSRSIEQFVVAGRLGLDVNLPLGYGPFSLRPGISVGAQSGGMVDGLPTLPSIALSLGLSREPVRTNERTTPTLPRPVADPPLLLPERPSALSISIRTDQQIAGSTALTARFVEVDRCVRIEMPTSVTRPEFEQALERPVVPLSDHAEHALSGSHDGRPRPIDILLSRLAADSPAKISVRYDTGTHGSIQMRSAIDRWAAGAGLDPATIDIAHDPGTESIVLESSDSTHTLPLLLHRFERDFSAPTMEISTSQRSTYESWEIVLENDGERLGHLSNGGRTERSTGIDWAMLYRESDMDTSTVTAVMTAVDSIGRVSTARDEAILVVEKHRGKIEESTDAEGRRRIDVSFSRLDSVVLDRLRGIVDRIRSVDPEAWIAVSGLPRDVASSIGATMRSSTPPDAEPSDAGIDCGPVSSEPDRLRLSIEYLNRADR